MQPNQGIADIVISITAREQVFSIAVSSLRTRYTVNVPVSVDV